MNHHGNKQRKSGVTACTTVRQVRLQPPPVASSLAIRHWGGGWPPALSSGGNGNGGIGPFGTGGDTLRTWVFSYTQFPGKMAMERQGGRVREKVLFQQCLQAHLKKRTFIAAARRLHVCGGTKGLGVGSMKNHGIKQSKLDSVVKSSGCRYVERASSFDILV